MKKKITTDKQYAPKAPVFAELRAHQVVNFQSTFKLKSLLTSLFELTNSKGQVSYKHMTFCWWE